MVEVVVIHDMAEVMVGEIKKLVWVGTETFTITHLEDDGKTISSSVEVKQQSITEKKKNKKQNDNNRTIRNDEECSVISSSGEGRHKLIRKDGVMILCSRYDNIDDDDDDVDGNDDNEINNQSNNRVQNNSEESSSSSINSAASTSNAENHTRTINLSQTTCEFCLQDFPSLAHKRRHKRTRHYYCVHCDKQYNDAYSIQMHPCANLRIDNGTGNKNNSKTKDDTESNSLASRIEEIRKLPTTTTTATATTTTQITISKPSPMIPYSSMSINDLQNVTGEVCPICKKVFRSNYMLKRHVIIHTGEKPFKCEICYRGFTQLAGMARHRREIHFGINSRRLRNSIYQYSCKECGKIFKDLVFLQLHQEMHRKDSTKSNDDDINGSDSSSSFNNHFVRQRNYENDKNDSDKNDKSPITIKKALVYYDDDDGLL